MAEFGTKLYKNGAHFTSDVCCNWGYLVITNCHQMTKKEDCPS